MEATPAPERFADRMTSLNIRVSSPDRSVAAKYTVAGGIEISLDAEAYSRHAERTLQEQVNVVIKGVRQGYDRAVTGYFRDRYGETEATEPSPTLGARKRQFASDVEAILVRGSSPHNYVTATMAGDGETVVSIRSGALDRFNVGRLAAEINTAVGKAREEYARAKRKIHEVCYSHTP